MGAAFLVLCGLALGLLDKFDVRRIRFRSIKHKHAFALFLLIHKFLAVLHNDSAESVAHLLTCKVEYLVAQSSLTSSDIADAVGTTAYELESVAAKLALRIEGIISLASFHVEGDIAKGGTVLSLLVSFSCL